MDAISRDLLRFDYRMEGDVRALDLPAQQAPRQRDGLWRRTCFEAFVRAPGTRGYLELNFSPSTEWAIYRFDGYRRGMHALTPKQAPKIVCHESAGALTVTADVHLAALGFPAEAELELVLAVVLQAVTGSVSYWALVHPAGDADFHDPCGFAHTLTIPSR